MLGTFRLQRRQLMSGSIEQHGIDLVPSTERHGKPSGLFFLWAGTTINIFTLSYGAMLVIVFHLSFFQAVAAIILGNLLSYPLLSLTTIQGPLTGTTNITISRAFFGWAGARINGFLSWVMYVGFEAGGLVLIYYATKALLDSVGISIGSGTGIALIVGLGAIQALIPFFGHTLLMEAQKYASIIFTLLFIALAVAIFPKTDIASSQADFSLFSFISATGLVMVSGGFSWAPSGADFSRYLPVNTSRWAVGLWSALGGFVPYVLLQVFGAAMATVAVGPDVDVTNPLAVPTVLPPSFTVPFFLLTIFGLIIQNATNLYSSSLNLLTAGIRAPRMMVVISDSILTIIITIIAVSQSSFYDLLKVFLASLGIWLAPWCAINLFDFLMRRGRYNLDELRENTPGSKPFDGAGFFSLIAGMVVAYLFSNSGYFVGPLAALLSPENPAFAPDLSVAAGFITSAVLYSLTHLRLVRTSTHA